VIQARPYRGADDLRRMQALQVEAVRRRKPFGVPTAGDVTWWLLQHPPADASPKRVVVFEEAGEVVAWAVLWLPATLTYGGDAHDAVLDWFEAEAEADGPLQVATLEDEPETRAPLDARGYEVDGADDWLHHLVADLDETPAEPRLPDGYRLAAVTEELLPSRVEAHRSAFHPSRVTVESYAAVTRDPVYRPELDVVAVAPDGTVAAYALAWLDAENALGELEPVGTHAEHRRRGLARAVCLEALRRLREAGADTCLVYSVHGSDATELYRSVGFRDAGRHVVFARSREG
jgi:ribosomal protein S18 acetylase RimI-like enzyme